VSALVLESLSFNGEGCAGLSLNVVGFVIVPIQTAYDSGSLRVFYSGVIFNESVS